MHTREPNFPLFFGLIVAALLHAMLLPLGTQVLQSRGLSRPPSAMRVEQILPERDDPLRIGQTDGKRSSLAWISHEDYREMLAKKGSVVQPAAQQLVDPTLDAPMEPDPTPPAPVTPPAPIQTVQADQAAPQASQALPPTPQAPPVPETPPSPQPQLALAPPAAWPMPALPTATDVPTPPRLEPTPQPTTEPRESTAAPTPAERTTQPAPVTPPARPTAAPRSDLDSTPVDLTDTPLKIRPGRVIAMEGITLKTAAPSFSAVAMATALPDNPTVRIVFNRQGIVTDARITRSSQYPNVDGPILASLYKWTAQGPLLEKLDNPFAIDVNIILTPE